MLNIMGIMFVCSKCNSLPKVDIIKNGHCVTIVTKCECGLCTEYPIDIKLLKETSDLNA